METVPVCIIGAGPSGLALGLALAQLNVKSIILEKAKQVIEDPRGAVLRGESIRILHALGVGDQLDKIGHVLEAACFHRTSFREPTLYTMPLNQDILSQSVPDAIVQNQPRLENALRSVVDRTELCELRNGCEVVECSEGGEVVRVKYVDGRGLQSSIEASWLVGADGKRGIVRKAYLEPKADIRQLTGAMKYSATWVIANLKLTLPTPATHPDLPCWSLGLTPEQVYDLFWPKDWHFCTPPGPPIACGRIGTVADRLWRHEIAMEYWNDSMDPAQILLDNIRPMITRDCDANGTPFSKPFTYPEDCIQVHRCAPAFFTQKVVNRWFHGRTVLIGDAAHVFPPFAGQGIACGVQDAHSLAWRLALLLKSQPQNTDLAQDVLAAWSKERVMRLDQAVRATVMCGTLLHSGDSWSWFVVRWYAAACKRLPFLRYIPRIDDMLAQQNLLRSPACGFHLSRLNGGFKMAQGKIDPSTEAQGTLSDEVLLNGSSVLTLIVVGEVTTAERLAITDMLSDAHVAKEVLSLESVRCVTTADSGSDTAAKEQSSFGVWPVSRCSWWWYRFRLGFSTRFAIVRPDFVVFATAKDLNGLKSCVRGLQTALHT